jgi:putative oxidoreductase
MISIIMLGAIFMVKGASSITGKGGVELDLILLASSLVIMIVGPGRISLAHIIKKIPRCLH